MNWAPAIEMSIVNTVDPSVIVNEVCSSRRYESKMNRNKNVRLLCSSDDFRSNAMVSTVFMAMDQWTNGRGPTLGWAGGARARGLSDRSLPFAAHRHGQERGAPQASSWQSGVAQWRACWAHNPEVGGSNPFAATTFVRIVQSATWAKTTRHRLLQKDRSAMK